jgi:hypothetical protein
MDERYECMGCGHLRLESGRADALNVIPCPKCGRDMYRSSPGVVAAPSSSVPALTGLLMKLPAVPSRYGAGLEGPVPVEDEDEGDNPVVLPHTPFVVVLGFIFSLLPVICVAGLLISILGLRLVEESESRVRGRWLARAGIAVGAAMTILTVVLIASHR